MLKLHCALVDYRYKKDEIFRRIKVTVFAQLVSGEVRGLRGVTRRFRNIGSVCMCVLFVYRGG